MVRKIFSGARIFDGQRFHDDKALIVSDGRVEAIAAAGELPEGEHTRFEGGVLSAGFIDAQVNGGGGRMLNDEASAASMYMIADGHRPYGTTALLPTLITDTSDATTAAIEAAKEAVKTNRGVAGLHLEGPHLAPARKGAHLAELMRPVEDKDVKAFIAAKEAIGTLLVTMAAEQVTAKQVRELSEAGVTVSIGHSDCSSEAAEARFDAGARGVTHLFNAMSQLGHRAPGLVGAAIDHPSVWCGIIADGHHVDPKALRTALRAKRGEGKLFFVTDAMSLVGSEQDSFTLNGRTVRRERGGFCSKLVLSDGTLAGSDVDMASTVRYGVTYLELTLAEALRMATLYPARFLRLEDRGHLSPGARADLAHLTDALEVTRTFISGEAA
ncbi:N-acetylglucosamine-6-phosphate deacetylase [Rhizobium sp. R72]|uniref:N-acetylglucosamine-6-phosphate deacetylase n=1 Tax=unclassified Rhizobium TaxID=2613769 RepID=UPI000B530E51|nr:MULTISPECIES: N-acetylglucosamine-6-phosphate deacetylase [unclassified Rhizobium]OWV90967.1 N-acetylglucosamine-6-phosphate deacetylase [Rhizobium sp. R693]OWW00886.1 N-acetylglucosamine-6-phosphate deacetylase [Rhizobium sp. R72]OWW01265.1 N-acetylglucosamine-6-phosphate deacetylase [Rhizobium sp. R711]